jgi:hypothetical protein
MKSFYLEALEKCINQTLVGFSGNLQYGMYFTYV